MKSIPIMSVVAIVVGIVLIIYPTATLNVILFTVGAMLIISALSTYLRYANLKKSSLHPSKSMLLSVVVSGAIGLILVVSPLFLIGFIMILISVVLILGSVGQLITLLTIKRSGVAVQPLLYIIPAALLCLGFVMLAEPVSSAAQITSMFGAGIVLFSAMELINYMLKRKSNL